MQESLLLEKKLTVEPFSEGLLKWIGNKQRFAHEIISYFPSRFENYLEPFLGSGAILGTLAPKRAIASDVFHPLMDIWMTLSKSPETIKKWYADRWRFMTAGDKHEKYENIKASFNAKPNGADLLFLCRSCYGGVVRFRKMDGYMSTPCGIHNPMVPANFARRVDEWSKRTEGTRFMQLDYQEAFSMAKAGDMIYCDPPYSHSQSILYGAQSFSFDGLIKDIALCKSKGVFVALSIDGMKKSGKTQCDLPIPDGLFEREIFISCGRSMLKRFQMVGQNLESEVVEDRLLLTY